MPNIIDLDNLTVKDVEKLKKVLGIKEQESDEQAMLRRQQEIGTRPGWVKLSQINIGRNKYFFADDEKKQEFLAANVGIEMESFDIELPMSTANKYLEETARVLKKGKQNG